MRFTSNTYTTTDPLGSYTFHFAPGPSVIDSRLFPTLSQLLSPVSAHSPSDLPLHALAALSTSRPPLVPHTFRQQPSFVLRIPQSMPAAPKIFSNALLFKVPHTSLNTVTEKNFHHIDIEDQLDSIFERADVHKGQVYKPWLEKFKLLLKYKALNGHCDVPLKYELEGKKLGIWVNEQRRYKVGKKNRNTLAPERVALLNAIDFSWVGSQQRNKKWMENFEILRQFKEDFGHCYIPQKCTYKGFNLGEWVNNQRKCRNGVGGRTMAPEREELLDSIDFIWRVQEKRGSCNDVSASRKKARVESTERN